MPGTQMAKDLLDDPFVVNDGDDTHGVVADRAAERVDVPDPQDEVAPAFGGQFEGRGRGEAGTANHQFRGQSTLAEAAHFVGVPAVVADHLGALVGDVLGDGGEEVGGGEELEIAIDFGVKPGAVGDGVVGGFESHLLDREWVAQDVLGEVLEIGLVFGGDGLSGMEVEAAVFPGIEKMIGVDAALLSQGYYRALIGP